MTTLRFSEDRSSSPDFNWAEDYGAERGIGFYADFTTGHPYNSGLNPDSTYTDWQWYVALTDDGEWTVVNGGQG